MCNCMNRIAEELKAKLTPKVTEGGVISDTETGWDNQMLDFSAGKSRVMLNYKFAYRAKKKNGEMAKNLTRLDMVVSMSHCPFCGEKQD
ncbi:hypothetical protein AB7360_05265 [Providencia alcalifaciens]|uniref:hypothetical protein n=1 Tax=Providencia alcalifaciens TaxID=126385 RepID=UPI0032DAF991